MTTSREPLFVRPLFYDALSGEFTAPTDNLRRKHTLGRLAYASYAKGEHRVNEDVDPPYLECLYVPSWAGHVSVQTDFDFDENGVQPTVLYGVQLKDNVERVLYIANEHPGIYIGTVDHEDLRFPLELGDNLARARAAVTDAVQSFFETIS